ncbi:sensor histidine kinase [Microlunatus kandeliicorticis]|nr:histidine kinase [Microlunatus kandeliicorticis]
MEAVDDRWGGGNGTVRLLVRLVGNSAFGYLLWRDGAFSGPLWVALCTSLCVALAFALMLLRVRRRYDRLAFALTLVMMTAAIAANPWISSLGSVYYVIGGIMLVGQPEVRVRTGVIWASVLGVALVLTGLVHGVHWSSVFGNTAGVAAVVLFGTNRRQRVLRRQQELTLAERNAQLKERQAALTAQTARTREEAARAAALEERSRIARDLHDLLAHALGGLVVQLDAAGAELERGRTDEAAARLRASRALAVEGLREARAAVQELRAEPAERGPVDLVDAVRAVLQGPVGVQLGIELDVVGDPRPVGGPVAETLAAVAREGLTNLNKHAPGGRGSATLVFATDRVLLELVNALVEPGAGDGGATGTGLTAPGQTAPGLADPGLADPALADTGAGAGLPGLRERLALVGGRLRAGREGGRWVLAAECPVPPEPRSAGPVADTPTTDEDRSTRPVGELR